MSLPACVIRLSLRQYCKHEGRCIIKGVKQVGDVGVFFFPLHFLLEFEPARQAELAALFVRRAENVRGELCVEQTGSCCRRTDCVHHSPFM